MPFELKPQTGHGAKKSGAVIDAVQRRSGLNGAGYEEGARKLSPRGGGAARSWSAAYGSGTPILNTAGVYAESGWVRFGRGFGDPKTARMAPLLHLSVGGMTGDAAMFHLKCLPLLGASGSPEGCLLEVAPADNELIGFHGESIGRAMNMRFDMEPIKSGPAPEQCEVRLIMTGDVMSQAGRRMAPALGGGDFTAELIVDGNGKIRDFRIEVRRNLYHEDFSTLDTGVSLHFGTHGLDAPSVKDGATTRDKGRVKRNATNV